MILFKYEKLFSVQALHNYYSSKACPDLIFEPTAECQQSLLNLNLKYKTGANGFTIFAETDEVGDLLKSFSGAKKLVFALRSNNPYFHNFSDLPLEQEAGEIYYFNNSTTNSLDVFSMGTARLLMHSGTEVSSSHLLKIFGDNYRFELSGTGAARTASLINLDQGTTVKTQEKEAVNNAYQYDFTLEGLVPGRYRLDVGGTEEDRFYYDPVLCRKKIIGLVEIFFSVPTSYRFYTGAGKPNYKEYCLAFQNRKTFWRYIVYNKNGTSLPDPIINQATNPWTFTDSGGGVFVSDSVIPLQESAITGISLLADSTDPSSVLLENLPNPDLTIIKPDLNNLSTIYSDVNVYI